MRRDLPICSDYDEDFFDDFGEFEEFDDDKVIVTRHKNIAEYFRKVKGINARCIEYARPEDVHGKIVYGGTIAPHLMSFAEKTSEVTNFMFVTPLLSTIMGFMILKEVPNAGTFIGGAIIIASIIVFNLKGK